MTLIIAHRGASAYEWENSLAAFRAAQERGADAVELDVHVTRDGVPVVHHDPVAGGRVIAQAEYRDLGDFRLPNGEPLPTLAAALALILPALEAFIEVKDLPPEHDASLLDVLDRCPAPSRCQVHAFDHRIVHRLGERRQALRCGVLSVSRPIRPLQQLRDARAVVLWQHEAMVDRELVEELHAGGAKVMAWTVDDPVRIRVLAALGADGICTNRPDVARAALP